MDTDVQLCNRCSLGLGQLIMAQVFDVLKGDKFHCNIRSVNEMDPNLSEFLKAPSISIASLLMLQYTTLSGPKISKILNNND